MKKSPDHGKYFTSQEFNNLTVDILVARLAEAKLTAKNDIANFGEKTGFDEKLKILIKKVTSNKKNLNEL